MPGIVRQAIQAMERHMAQVRAWVMVDVIEMPQQRPETNGRNESGDAHYKPGPHRPAQSLQRQRKD